MKSQPVLSTRLKPAIANYFTDTPTNDELKHVNHLGFIDGYDVHLLKVVKRFPDGGRYSEIQILKDFQRPWWREPPILQVKKDENGKKIPVRRDKKEYISESKVTRRMATESNLNSDINMFVQQPERGPLEYKKRRAVAKDPYIYGASIPAEAFIKDWYIRNGKSSRWKVCNFDIEVNIKGDIPEYVTHISMATEDEAFLGIMRERFTRHGAISDEEIIRRIKEEYYREVKDGEALWNSKPREVKMFDCQYKLIEYAFALTHQWDIDFLSIWNMGYDLPKIASIYETEFRSTTMADLLKDPMLPDSYATYEFIKGRDKIVTKLDNGKEKISTFKLHEIWDEVVCSSGYKVIDAMKSFYQLRSQSPDIEGGFSLDNVLHKVAKINKLKDPDAAGRTKAEQHIFSSDNKPFYYSAYSMFDSDGMLILDDVTKDLQLTVPNALGAAPFAKMNSLPQRLHVALAFDMLTNKVIVGTNGIREPDPILGIGKGWIVTLPAYRMDTVAMKCIQESGGFVTSHYGHVYDMDEVSAYPFATAAANVGKETTRCELISMNGHGKELFLEQNINLIMNRTNAPMYVRELFGIPSFGTMLEEIESGEYLNSPVMPPKPSGAMATRRVCVVKSTKAPKPKPKKPSKVSIKAKKRAAKIASMADEDMELMNAMGL